MGQLLLIVFAAFTAWSIWRALTRRLPSDFARIFVGIGALLASFTTLPGRLPLLILAIVVTVYFRLRERKAGPLGHYERLVRSEHDDAELMRILSGVQHGVMSVGPAGVRDLVALLSDPHPIVRPLAAFALARVADQAALEAFRKVVSTNERLRISYVAAVVRRGGPAFDTEIAEYVASSDRSVRTAALRNLIVRGGESNLARVVSELAQETDERIVSETARSFLKHKQLARLLDAWGKFPARTRRQIAASLLSGKWEGHQQALSELYDRAVKDDDRNVALAAKEAGRHNKPEQAAARESIEPPKVWIPLSIGVGAGRLRCKGGTLIFSEGELKAEIRVRHERHPKDGDEFNELRIDARFADAKGAEWKVRSFLLLAGLTDAIDDDARRNAVKQSSGFIPWKDAPPAWRDALRKRRLLTDVKELLDSRMRFELEVGATAHIVMMKYQSPSLDVALLERSLVVRVSGLFEELWDGEDFLGPAEIPPFAWLADASLLLCFAQPEYHCASFEEILEFAEPGDGKSPIARRTERTIEPQPTVVFRPKAEGV